MSHRVPSLYRILLRLYPAEFRREFETDVLRLIAQDLEGSAGFLRLARHMSATLDLVISLIHQCAADCRRAAGWVLLGFAAANVGYDVAMPNLSMGYFAWAVTLIAIASGVLLSTSASRPRRA